MLFKLINVLEGDEVLAVFSAAWSQIGFCGLSGTLPAGVTDARGLEGRLGASSSSFKATSFRRIKFI